MFKSYVKGNGPKMFFYVLFISIIIGSYQNCGKIFSESSKKKTSADLDHAHNPTVSQSQNHEFTDTDSPGDDNDFGSIDLRFPGDGPDDHAAFYNRTSGKIKIGASIYDYQVELDVGECAYYKGSYYDVLGRINPLMVVTDDFGKGLDFEICGWGNKYDCEQKIRDSHKGLMYTQQSAIPGWMFSYNITDTKEVFEVAGRIHRDLFQYDQCKPFKEVLMIAL